MHVAPSEGTPRDVAGPVMDMLFPPGSAEPHPDRVDHRHQRQDHHGAHAGARLQAARPPRRAHHHRRRLHRRPAHGEGRHDRTGRRRGWCCATRRSDVADARDRARRAAAPRHGLPQVRRSARCSTSPSDHLGLKGIDTLEQLAEVKRIVIEVAHGHRGAQRRRPAAACKMADYSSARHVCYVTMNIDHPLVKEHIRAGGRAVVLEAGHQRPHDHASTTTGAHIPLLWTHLDPRHARGPGAAQRAERDVRRRRWRSAWASSSRTSATACAPSTPASSRPRTG